MPSGEHPFDGDMVLIKNKNKNKNKGTQRRGVAAWGAVRL